MVQIEIMAKADTQEKMNEIADEILVRNQHVGVVWDAKAIYCYGKGDFKGVIENKNKAIDCLKYSIEEYENYAGMLFTGIDLYRKNNDTESADYLIRELQNIPRKLEELKRETPDIAYRLSKLPSFELSEETVKKISEITKLPRKS